jgi:hypothetical protein
VTTIDPETRRHVRANWIESLYEFAAPPVQHWWLGGGPPGLMFSFVELMCGYFDDLNLSAGLEAAVRSGWMTAAEAQASREFHQLAARYPEPPGEPESVLADPAWADVVEAARRAWFGIREVTQDPETLGAMQSIEARWGRIEPATRPAPFEPLPLSPRAAPARGPRIGTGDPEATTHRNTLEQLLTLSPKSKCVVGIVLLVGGLAASVILWLRGWIVGWALLAILLGLGLSAVGRRDLLRVRAIEAETSRARREWHELASAVEATRREGKNVARFLQGRGYQVFEVRRWIVQALGEERIEGDRRGRAR